MNNQAVETLGSLLVRHPNAIALNLRNSGIKVPRNANSEQLENIILNNRNNSDMIQVLSAMVLADIQFSEPQDFSGIQRIEPRPATNVLTGESMEFATGGEASSKTGFFSKIGSGIKNIFGGNKNSATTDGLGQSPTKEGGGIGDWFKKNSSDILDVGTSLIGGLFGRNKGGNTQTPTGGGGGGVVRQPNYGGVVAPQPTGMSTGTKILLGVGGVGLIVTIILLARRRGKG